MAMTLQPNLAKMSFVNRDRNSYYIKEDIWRSNMSGVGQVMALEVEMDNKLGVKKKTMLCFRVLSDGRLCGGVVIELAEGVNFDDVEYAANLSLKKSGLESYASPLMMEEPDVKITNRTRSENRNEFFTCNMLSEKYEVEGFLKHYLEDSFIIVEVVSEMSMNGGQVDKERNRKVKVVEEIEKVWMNGETSDFLVVCNDAEFQCHKTILSARSPVFAMACQRDRRDEGGSHGALGHQRLDPGGSE